MGRRPRRPNCRPSPSGRQCKTRWRRGGNNSSPPRLEVATNGTTERRDSLAEELARLLQVVEAALLLEEPALVTEQLQWLRVTAPGHGFATPLIDEAVRALAAAMDGALQDVSLLLA